MRQQTARPPTRSARAGRSRRLQGVPPRPPLHGRGVGERRTPRVGGGRRAWPAGAPAQQGTPHPTSACWDGATAPRHARLLATPALPQHLCCVPGAVPAGCAAASCSAAPAASRPLQKATGHGGTVRDMRVRSRGGRGNRNAGPATLPRHVLAGAARPTQCPACLPSHPAQNPPFCRQPDTATSRSPRCRWKSSNRLAELLKSASQSAASDSGTVTSSSTAFSGAGSGKGSCRTLGAAGSSTSTSSPSSWRSRRRGGV